MITSNDRAIPQAILYSTEYFVMVAVLQERRHRNEFDFRFVTATPKPYFLPLRVRVLSYGSKQQVEAQIFLGHSRWNERLLRLDSRPSK